MIKYFLIIIFLTAGINKINAQTIYNKDFFKRFYTNAKGDVAVEFHNEKPNDLVGVIKSISINKYQNDKNDVAYGTPTFLTIHVTEGDIKGHDVVIYYNSKENLAKCNDCLHFLSLMKIDKKIHFKFLSVGTGELVHAYLMEVKF